MNEDGPWTIGELGEGVLRALHSSGLLEDDSAGQADRRVRSIPDERTIRWYSTIGLLDRPVAMRGRTALYGRRHLLQLVAVKRLQAQGRSLAEVQEALVGATDSALEGMAQLPVNYLEAEVNHGATGRSTRFWTAAAAPAAAAPLEVMPAVRLGDGVTLLLGAATRMLNADDLAMLEQAAAPLMRVLRARGLDGPNSGGETR